MCNFASFSVVLECHAIAIAMIEKRIEEVRTAIMSRDLEN